MDTVKALYAKERIVTENSDLARELWTQSRFGSQLEDGRVQLSFLEALYLADKKRIDVFDSRNKLVSFQALFQKIARLQKELWIKYAVFKDLRNRGYIVKTALKFGADFRVYDKGVKPGEDHARWVVYPVHETKSLTWHDFASKNRVAHSTKKRLMMAVVDDEGDVSYWEVRWLRP